MAVYTWHEMKVLLRAHRSRNGHYRMTAVISMFSKLVHSHYIMFALMSTDIIVDGERLSRGQSLRKCSALELLTSSTSAHQVEYY